MSVTSMYREGLEGWKAKIEKVRVGCDESCPCEFPRHDLPIEGEFRTKLVIFFISTITLPQEFKALSKRVKSESCY
jgi:hypothetical protein